MRRLLLPALALLAASVSCLSTPSGATPSIAAVASPTAEAPTPAFPGWIPYSSEACGLEVLYPPDATFFATDAEHVRIYFSIAAGTNLSEKWLQVDVEPASDPCLTPLAQGFDPSALNTSTVAVGGTPFLRQEASDAGAGNFYNWVAYSASADCGCISLSFVLHSLNAMNFPTPPPLYDQAAESMVFDQVLSTFHWLAP
jgi:hypothetical protein